MKKSTGALVARLWTRLFLLVALLGCRLVDSSFISTTKQGSIANTHVERYSEKGDSLWSSNFLVSPVGVFQPSIIVDEKDNLLVAGTYLLPHEPDDWASVLFLIKYSWLGEVTQSALYRSDPRIVLDGVAIGADGALYGVGTTIEGPNIRASAVFYPPFCE